jgi:transposase
MARPKRSRPDRDILPTHPNAAAIDIGAKMHVVAVAPNRDAEPVRSFGTFTGDLHRLAKWLERCGVRTVAMESTGVYWIPVFEVLDQRGFNVVLVNARDAKHVPGRKTDVSDAQWLRQLHEYGLLRASFRPKGELATLRAYLRQRERLLDYAASHIQHMQGADANERPAASYRIRHHRRYRDAHCSRNCGGRARPGGTCCPPGPPLPCVSRRDQRGFGRQLA